MEKRKILVKTQNFDDFDDYSSAAQKWDTKFTQLDSGSFQGKLNQIFTGPIFINQIKFSRKFKISGLSPRNYRTFGIPFRTKNEAYFNGKLAHENSILIYQEDGEFEAVTPADFHSIEVSISNKLLKETAYILGIENINLYLESTSIFSCNPKQLNQLKNYLLEISEISLSNRVPIKFDSIKNNIEENVPKLLLQNILLMQERQKYYQSDKRRNSIKKVEKIVNELPSSHLSIPELCKLTNVSQRTLEYSFHELFNLTPQQYIKNIKLNHVRRILKQADPKLVKIAVIAKENDFLHPGQFAKDYKDLFGELPSQTLYKA